MKTITHKYYKIVKLKVLNAFSYYEFLKDFPRLATLCDVSRTSSLVLLSQGSVCVDVANETDLIETSSCMCTAQIMCVCVCG